jgi:hypothetical protein
MADRMPQLARSRSGTMGCSQTEGEAVAGQGDEFRQPAVHGFDLDAAVGRLEDVLLAQPYDRALPDLPALLRRAGIPAAVLRDDRALKALNEAVLARPFSQLDEVVTVRVEVELLTLEVEVLTDRLATRDIPDVQLAAAAQRLQQVRDRLEEIRDNL